MAKNFRTVERVQLRVRLEAYNALISTTRTGAHSNSAFGSLTSSRSPRIIQLGARVLV